jgi:type IV fimbrial biogenesis protein FimT
MNAPSTGRQAGFTLVELMVAIAVLAVLLALAAPSFTNASLPSKLRSVANSLVGAALLARSEAIKRDAVVTLCVSADGATCGAGNWSQGWIVTAGAGTIPLQSVQAAPTGFRVTPAGGAAALTFQPSGVGATTETFTICRSTPTAGAQERSVSISAVGRPSVQTTTNGVCP